MVNWTEEDLEALLSDSTVRLGLSCLLEPIRVLSEQIGVIEGEVLAKARLREEFQKLKTVWGIGEILALTIMYVVGEIPRFPSAGDFASYCRLVPTDRLSDKGARVGGIARTVTATCRGPSVRRPTTRRVIGRRRSVTNNARGRRQAGNATAPGSASS